MQLQETEWSMQTPHQSKKGHVVDNNVGSNASCNMDFTPGIYIPQDDELQPMAGENMDCNRSLLPLQQPPRSGGQTDGNRKPMETDGPILGSRWFPQADGQSLDNGKDS